MKLQYYKNCKSPDSALEINPETWIEEIKGGYKHKKEIQEARYHYQLTGKKGMYETIKEKKIPVIAWNFRFNGTKSNNTATVSTGFLYYDIDGEKAQNFDVSQLNTAHIFSFFKSVSQNGLGLIVKVEGVTKENFYKAYDQVAEKMGLLSVMDKKSRTPDRNNVLTYDPNCFFNQNCTPIVVNPELFKKEEETKKVQSTSIYIKGGEYIEVNCTFFRYSNSDLYVKPMDFEFFPEGVQIVQVYLPSKIAVGKRRVTLGSYCNNLVWLNPNRTEEQVYDHLMFRNKKRCEEPLSPKEIKQLVDSIFKLKNEGKLEPLEVKIKKMIFGSKSSLTMEEKLQTTGEQMGIYKKNKTKQLIYQTIEAGEIVGKVTAASVAKATGLSLRTIKGYWSEFKEYVKEINEHSM